MIKLYAMIEEEGTAIVEVGKDNQRIYFLVRPPYKDGTTVFNERNLGSAICNHRFSMADAGREFDDYASLFEFLNQKCVEVRERAGFPIPTQEELIKELNELGIIKHGRK